MQVTDVSHYTDFDHHEAVYHCADPASGLRAYIAIHNTSRGPALGGCRMWPYASEDEAITDVLRLSRGMTYKSALADLPLGGGKAVIIGDRHRDKTPELLRAMGDFIESVGGRYITAEDSGTSVADMAVMAERTGYVSGVDLSADHGGDPSPSTAYGTYVALSTAVRHRLGRADLDGLRVAIQGVGSVGYHLARHLADAGAQLFVSDIYADSVHRAVDDFAATAVAPDDIYDLDVDVFSPCAMGSILNDDTIARLRATVVAGAANNQLAQSRHGAALHQRGILYAPDYVANAAGIIDIAYQYQGLGREAMLAHIDRIGVTLEEIFQRSDTGALPTHEVADRLARERFSQGQ